MRKVIVQYRVKPEEVEHNESLVRAVYEELHSLEPSGFHYATFQLEDRASFVHVAIESGDGGNPLPELESFKRFQQGIGERCVERPVVQEMREVGSYRLPGD